MVGRKQVNFCSRCAVRLRGSVVRARPSPTRSSAMLFALIGIAVVAASIGVLVYLANMLWGAARGPVGAFFERQQFDRHVAQVQRGDRYLRDGGLEQALGAF